MSKIAKNPIPVPQGITAVVKDGAVEISKGKSFLSKRIPAGVSVVIEAGMLKVGRLDNSRQSAMSQGSMFSHVRNMFRGVAENFTKVLLLEGVGYRAQVKGDTLTMTLGFSHPVSFTIPSAIKVEAPEQTRIVVSGPDKELVGQVASEIRKFKKPEPYQGKGIRYDNERIRRKAGKAAAK